MQFFKEYLLRPICWIALVLVALFILNHFTNFNISLSSNNTLNTFEVIGSGKVSGTPQNARISFTVTQKGPTQEAAKNAANTIQNQAISTLLSLGVKKTDIQTNTMNVNPNYEQDTGVAQPMIYPIRQTQNGYVATISTQVKGTVDQINKAVDALSGLGANVGGIEYISTDQTSLMMQAQRKAIEDARTQAQNIAAAAGFKLGKIISIRNADDQQGGPIPYANSTLKAPSDTSTNLQPGQNELTAHMAITYSIK